MDWGTKKRMPLGVRWVLLECPSCRVEGGGGVRSSSTYFVGVVRSSTLVLSSAAYTYTVTGTSILI